MGFFNNLFGTNEQEILAKAKAGERNSGIIIFDLAYTFADILINSDGKSSAYKCIKSAKSGQKGV
ncbi:hypothetical protein Q0590_23385 [Rhodocytophaga aerolata]|uniref:Uncharacterized protein n=1 Tax=Rhodocytophaga aerolata TaxID=455078 RepID=A0ABT8RAW0_9BACT|nr:hypothetical protein [Rhodocytophaga aerolata]MDO1449240.1 hypothetical protein [Rhodocytophaga aerolata]